MPVASCQIRLNSPAVALAAVSVELQFSAACLSAVPLVELGVVVVAPLRLGGPAAVAVEVEPVAVAVVRRMKPFPV